MRDRGEYASAGASWSRNSAMREISRTNPGSVSVPASREPPCWQSRESLKKAARVCESANESKSKSATSVRNSTNCMLEVPGTAPAWQRSVRDLRAERQQRVHRESRECTSREEAESEQAE